MDVKKFYEALAAIITAREKGVTVTVKKVEKTAGRWATTGGNAKGHLEQFNITTQEG